MQFKYSYILVLAALMSACAYDDPEVKIEDSDFPLRLQMDEAGADLPDAEDYGIEISFADYLGALPSQPVTLSYVLQGEGDFANAAIDAVFYEYEDDDCVFEREMTFTANTITLPVDPDLGTVPEAFEIVVLLGLEEDQEAEEGTFTLEITAIETADNVVFSDANTFEYEILDNDAAGEWVLELDETGFEAFRELFGPVSPALAALSYTEITGEVTFEFEFEEVKIEIELEEEEELTTCENGETETEVEHLVIEIEAEYEAEEGEIELEGSYFTEDGEELDFIAQAKYTVAQEGLLILEFSRLVDEDHFEEGDELFSGSISFTLTED